MPLSPNLSFFKEHSKETESKIVLLVMDGLGGLPMEPGGLTELEYAKTPNLDELAARSSLGLTEPVAAGITPGSGPGHLGLFGYDPLEFRVGRGVLEALGIDFPLQKNDLAARGNFCSLDTQGRITDRRAGRPSDDGCRAMAAKLDGIKVDNVECMVRPVREHRFVLVMRGKNLSDELSETDPQTVSVPPLEVQPLAAEANETVPLVNAFIAEARKRLAQHHPTNGVLLRGFARQPDIPTLSDIFRLNPAAIAVYPMYRGLAKLVGMTIIPPGSNLNDQIKALRSNWGHYDFFFIHFKSTDSRGEDGNFEEKARAIEQVDALIPNILNLQPDVLVVTGDHSTPAKLQMHSWHSVPLLLHSRFCRTENEMGFGEARCVRGHLSRIRHVDILPLALAHALKLEKFGA